MGLTDAQRATVEGLDRKGFHLNDGEPCECGPENVTTRVEHGYSDYITYYHTCHTCGESFSTYIEG